MCSSDLDARGDLDLTELPAPAERLLPDALQPAPARKRDARQRRATEAALANLLDARRDLDLTELTAPAERLLPGHKISVPFWDTKR